MQQAQTVEVIAQAIMPLFKVVPTSRIHWKTSIRNFTREDVMNMAASLRTHGQLSAISVKPQDEKGMYEGILGRIRFEAAKHAHLPTILVRVRNVQTEDEILEMQLVENLHRKGMTALEKAAAYGQLAQLRRKTFREESVIQGIAMSIEGLTGVKPALQTVREYLRISAKIGKEARKIADTSAKEKAPNVKVRHLRQLCRIKDQNKQAELLLNTATKQWTVQKLKQAVDKTLGISKQKPQPISTGLKVLCPRCQETLELIHVAAGRHTLKKVTGSR